jgi:DNA-binding CsgD family transcriptional regulator
MILAHASKPGGVSTFAKSSPIEIHLANAVAAWCQGLQGKCPLPTLLDDLIESLNARSVRLSRQPRAACAPARALSAGVAAGLPAARSLAQGGSGQRAAPLRPALVWFTSTSETGAASTPTTFSWPRPSADAAVVVLAVEQDWADCIEIRFAAPIGRTAQAHLIVLANRLSASWTKHGAQLLSKALRAGQAELPSRSRAIGAPDEPILCLANPARLTRAEFRLCVLLSQGFDAEGARAELAISRSMLRTHLRSVFAKTGTSSLGELLPHLQASPQGQPAPSALPPIPRS